MKVAVPLAKHILVPLRITSAASAIDVETDQIYNHINESNKNFTKKSTEKSSKRNLIENLLKRILELEFKPNYSIKLKCLKYVVEKILLSL